MRLGYASPDRMLREMTSREVVEWMAYSDLLEFEATMRNQQQGGQAQQTMGQ